MREEVFMAGLGGQGVLLAGQLLAQTAIDLGLEVSWYPSYSPEVRGGEANCTVIIADERVGSPISGRPHNMILMAPRAVDAYLAMGAPGGLLVVNTGFGAVSITREDLTVVPIEADQLAAAAGSERVVNLVLLGAYLGVARPEWIEAAVAAIPRVLPERHHKFVPMNEEAIRRGVEAARMREA